MKKLVAAILMIAAVVLTGCDDKPVTPTPVPSAVTLPPCPNDSDVTFDCYWDAKRNGDGKGNSFIVIDGTTYPVGE